MALLEPLLQNTELQFLSLKVGMGSEWLDPESSVSRIVVHESEGATSSDDTIELASILVSKGADLILYAGGDGTTRDLVQTLEKMNQQPPRS